MDCEVFLLSIVEAESLVAVALSDAWLCKVGVASRPRVSFKSNPDSRGKSYHARKQGTIFYFSEHLEARTKN